MYRYKCSPLSVESGNKVCLNIDLGFDVHIVKHVVLANVFLPDVEGYSRGLGLQAREYIASWFEENSLGKFNYLIVDVVEHHEDDVYLVEIYAVDEPESLNSELGKLGLGNE